MVVICKSLILEALGVYILGVSLGSVFSLTFFVRWECVCLSNRVTVEMSCASCKSCVMCVFSRGCVA